MRNEFYQGEYEPIPGFPDYGVVPEGYVLNFRKGGVVLPYYRNQGGHCFVSMRDENGDFRTRHLAKLVIKAFKPQPEEHFDTVIYLDGDMTNTRIENLEWRPRWYATKYNREKRHPLRRGHFRIRDDETGEVYSNVREASIASGVLEEEILFKLGTSNRVFPSMQLFIYDD